jgi:signal transduction histidine kinase
MDTTENCAPTSGLLMAGPQSFLDSVVRMRGCLTVEWDPSTRQLQAGEIFLSPAIVSVEQTAPKEPFSIRRRRASDLLLFDVRASALQRTRIGGQVIHAGTRELYLLDGEIGVRVFTREPFTLALGDMIETVGFPQLGGPTPVLREALVRKTGSAPLPQAIRVSADDLVNGRHRSRLVELEALLVNDTSRRGERILELQSGSRHFTARLKAQPGKQAALSPGSRLAVMGVCAIGPADRLADSLNSFELLLESPAAVRVLKQPPWLTPQRALAIAGALAGGLIAALVWVSLLRRKVEERTRQLQKQIEARQRVEQRRVMEEERTRVAQDLHDELGAGLTEVSILGSLAKNPSIPAEKKDQYLDQLTDAARTLITELDEIVWAVNPHYDSVGSLASYYSLFAQRFLNLAGIACRLQIADRFPDYPLDSRLRHGIFLAFKEALNNIVRHSGATEVELRIETAEEFLVICVHDNGCGLLTDSRTPGHDGIASMHLRLKKLGGSCRLTSSPGAGARVEFRLPLNQPESMPATGSLS